jgi:hypothetical protein
MLLANRGRSRSMTGRGNDDVGPAEAGAVRRWPSTPPHNDQRLPPVFTHRPKHSVAEAATAAKRDLGGG